MKVTEAVAVIISLMICAALAVLVGLCSYNEGVSDEGSALFGSLFFALMASLPFVGVALEGE